MLGDRIAQRRAQARFNARVYLFWSVVAVVFAVASSTMFQRAFMVGVAVVFARWAWCEWHER